VTSILKTYLAIIEESIYGVAINYANPALNLYPA
jgi:hypothetical protein